MFWQTRQIRATSISPLRPNYSARKRDAIGGLIQLHLGKPVFALDNFGEDFFVFLSWQCFPQMFFVGIGAQHFSGDTEGFTDVFANGAIKFKIRSIKLRLSWWDELIELVDERSEEHTSELQSHVNLV